MTYQLFQGLKQILDDKRIRRFGVPDGLYNQYLLANQFVVDERALKTEELLDVLETFNHLDEYGLAKEPFDYFIIHAIRTLKNVKETIAVKENPEIAKELDGKQIIDSTFWFREDGHLYFIILSETYEMQERMKEFRNNPKYHEEAENDRAYNIGIMRKLIVFLATKGVIKDIHECKKSQQLVNGKPHKKGSGGYTIIRPPEPHELAGGAHASPRPHFRRGHIRKIDPDDKTRWVFVQPCFVNGEPEISRKAYLVKNTPQPEEE